MFSAMRPTGALHLGHYHGVLKNWIALQNTYDCFYSIVDWHALTTHYQNTAEIQEYCYEVLIDWLAAGLDPQQATIFIQSHVPAHAELHLLLSMSTPLSWLERVPTYKEQIQKLSDRDLGTYGFLGYPLLQTADILLYRAHKVPVGEDQIPHIEMAREIARRFNDIFGKTPAYDTYKQQVVDTVATQTKQQLQTLRKAWLELGKQQALADALALIEQYSAQQRLAADQTAALHAYLRDSGKQILTEPTHLLSPTPKMIGTDGQKMSKSYNNTIALRASADSIARTIKMMPTDPARVRLVDVGDPNKCPVWSYHVLHTPHADQPRLFENCTQAKTGCMACKKVLTANIATTMQPILERAKVYQNDRAELDKLLAKGRQRAQQFSEETMKIVRNEMGLLAS